MLLEEFAHGGGVEQFAKELGCNASEVIDLSSNINFIKPVINIDFNKLDISAYPTYDRLYQSIANNYTIAPENIELFNGGSSAIFTLFKHLNLKSCTIYSPAYLEYKKAAKKRGCDLLLINRLEAIEAKVKENSLVIFVNPSTPDGHFYEIETLLEYWDEQNCFVLVDESFLDFVSNNSVVKYLEKYPKLYVLKSMTKFYSSAGIRVGCIVSNKDNIVRLKEDEPMWKISQFDSTYLQYALKDSTFKQFAKTINIQNTILLQTILEQSPLFEQVFKSEVNFILVKLKSISANEFQEQLKPYKIMVRDCSNFDFLDNSYVRIAVKSEENIKRLKQALEEGANE